MNLSETSHAVEDEIAVIRPFDFTLRSKAMIPSIYELLRHSDFQQALRGSSAVIWRSIPLTLVGAEHFALGLYC